MNDPWPWQLLLQLGLILINAFFACTEIAILSLNQEKIKIEAENGDKSSKYLFRLMERPAKFLATIQVGITFAGFLASAFAAASFSGRITKWLMGLGVTIPEATLNTICVIVITFILSYFMLVLGELVPKRIAMKKAEKIARVFARAIFYLSKIFAPIVWLLTISTNGVLRLFKINPHENEKNITEEEIRIMVDLGEQRGAIAPEEGEMIDNVLELSDRAAVELMTPRTQLTVLWKSGTRADMEEIICKSSYSRYPVCGKSMDEIVGILHVRDFFCDKTAPIADLLRPAHFVPETVKADVLLRDMQKNKAHMAIIVDEYGGVSGVVTLEDLLEEIVGEIEDEHDNEQPFITVLEDGGWRVRGDVDLNTLGEAIGVSFPKGDYDTLGGLIFSRMNSIPQDGSRPEVDIDGVRIIVDEISDRHVTWAQIKVLPKTDEDE